MNNKTVARWLAVLVVVGLALGLNMVVAFAGSHEAPDREVRQELAKVQKATAKFHKFRRACSQGYSLVSDYVPHMGLHFIKQDHIINDKEVFDITAPAILLYVSRGDNRMKLVAVEYLALAGQIPEEMFPGVGPDAWDPIPGTGEALWGLHAWVWKSNPDGVFAPFNPDVPAEGTIVDCSSGDDGGEDRGRGDRRGDDDDDEYEEDDDDDGDENEEDDDD